MSDTKSAEVAGESEVADGKDEEMLLEAIVIAAKALGCEEEALETEYHKYLDYVKTLQKMQRSMTTGADVLRELEDPAHNQKHAVAHVMFPLIIRSLKMARLHPTKTASVERGFSAYKNLHTLLRNSLGEHKIDDAMFLFQNGPAIMTPEADEMLRLAVERFAAKKPRQFDALTYGNNSEAKAVHLEYTRKSRVAHIELAQTSLLVAGPVTEQQNHAATELFSELVQEGAAAQEKRDNAIRERKQQSAVERQQAAKDGVGHEAGSIAANRRHQARQVELERQGRFTTTDPLAGLSARPSRNAGKLLTEEQLLQVARRPGTKAKPPAAKKRKQQGEAKDISSFFKV